MSGYSTVLKWDTLRSLAFGSISGTYAAVGTSFTYPARIVKVINNTNADLTVSIDGTNDNDLVPAGGFFLYDCGTNRGNASPEMAIQEGTQIYVKGSPTSGSAYVVVLYAYTNQNDGPNTFVI